MENGKKDNSVPCHLQGRVKFLFFSVSCLAVMQIVQTIFLIIFYGEINTLKVHFSNLEEVVEFVDQGNVRQKDSVMMSEDADLLFGGISMGSEFKNSRQKRNVGVPEGSGDAGDWMWMSSSARIPTKAIKSYCQEAKTYCAASGPPGLPGPKGDKGDKGTDGITTSLKTLGASELEALRGLRGEPGVGGLNGVPGRPGAKGDKGNDGSTSSMDMPRVSRLRALRGPPGPAGIAGPKGERGDKGDNGIASSLKTLGASELEALRGPAGLDGSPGWPGLRGLPGKPGLKGDRGNSGLDGPMGLNGVQGMPGKTGDPGIPGPKGYAGRIGQKAEQGFPGVRGSKGENGAPGFCLEKLSQLTTNCGHTNSANKLQTKIAVNCPELDCPVYGNMIGSSTAFNSVIQFECNHGYKVRGSQERTCQADGTWSGQEATCVEINCGPPGPLYNGYLDGHRTTVGGLYLFRCNLRTKFIGQHLMTQCMDNGQWSQPTPLCLGQCQIPLILNGTIGNAAENIWVDPGTVIEPSCLNGFVLNDSRSVECINGTWSVVPKCIPAVLVTTSQKPSDQDLKNEIPTGEELNLGYKYKFKKY